jgi:hypothetical protein
MKKFLKSIVLFFLFVASLQAQRDTIPQSDTTSIVKSKNNRDGSRNSNYINMDLPGINLDGADFTPLDDTIRKLNEAGWDVKVIGYYGLSGSMDDNVYTDLLSNIRVDKQVIVKIVVGIENSNFEVEINDSNSDESVKELLELQIKLILNNQANSFKNTFLIKEIAKAIAFLISKESSTNDQIGNGNRFDMNGRDSYDKSGVIYKTKEDGYYLSIAGIPIWLSAGTTVYFFPDGNDINVFGEGRRAFGMVWAFITIQGKVYISTGAQDKEGKIVHDGFYEKVANTRYYSGKYLKKGAKTKVILGLLTECNIVSIREVEMTVNYEANGNSYGPRIGIDIVKNDFFKYTELKFVKSTSITNAHKIESKSVDLNSGNVENIIFKTTCYKLTTLFKSSGLGYITIESKENKDLFSQYYTQEGILLLTTDEAGNEKGWAFYSYADETFMDVDVDIETARNLIQLYKKVSLFGLRVASIVVPAILSGGASLVAELVIVGGIYLVNDDPKEAIIDVAMTLTGAGIAAGVTKFIDWKVAAQLAAKGDDVSKYASAEYKALSDAKNLTGKTSVNFIAKSDDGSEVLIDLTDVAADMKAHKFSDPNIKYTDADWEDYVNDVASLAEEGKHLDLLLLACSNGRAKKCKVTSAQIHKILSTIKDESSRAWVKKSSALHKKLANETEEKVNKVRDYYAKHRSNSDCKIYPCMSSTGQYYDELGHPTLESSVPKINDISGNPRHAAYQPSNGITGKRNEDALNANIEMKKRFGDDFDYKPNSNICKIKVKNAQNQDEWIECTWHHHQDGKTMMAVPTGIHNSSNAAHIGGVQAKEVGIIDFFDSPNLVF